MKNVYCGFLQFFLFAVIILSLTNQSVVGQANDYHGLRKFLDQPMYLFRNPEDLGPVFQQGDSKIDALIDALDDHNKDIRNNAQLAIRYLGNKKGMDAIFKSYGKVEDGKYSIVNSIPLPLTDWDYEFIRSEFLIDSAEFHILTIAYIYALAFDGSEKARKLLRQMKNNAKRLGIKFEPFKVLKMKIPHLIFADEGNLSEAVLKSTFFLSKKDRKVTKVKLISFNAERDKALFEVYVGRGILAEEWYHVVLAKYGKGWRFFSVSLVSYS
jgi:hypothetical protein